MKVRTPDRKYPPRLKPAVHAKVLDTPKVFMHTNLEATPKVEFKGTPEQWSRREEALYPGEPASFWETAAIFAWATAGTAAIIWIALWFLHG